MSALREKHSSYRQRVPAVSNQPRRATHSHRLTPFHSGYGAGAATTARSSAA